MKSNRLLFVDDEAGLRLTLPEILKSHGFDVRVAASVAEALAEITTQSFDVLISDLNIGQPGDGFTVVSAMRRTQPDCVNFIVTGFPAFESALAALQSQVDDYLVKPARIDQLVNLIQEKLRLRQPHCHVPPMRLSALLRSNLDEIRATVLWRMKADPELAAIEISDEERVRHLPIYVEEIAGRLDLMEPDEPAVIVLKSGPAYGAQRQAVGYEISMLVTETTILDEVVYDIVRSHLLLLDTSYLVLDLKRFNVALQLQLKQSIRAFWDGAGRSTGTQG